MGIFSAIFGRDKDKTDAAERLYRAVMALSRNPDLYGEERMPDSYDGRVDLLTMLLAPVMRAVSGQGEDGKALSQAVFDCMVNDFDTALREEGLTDAGVKRRIKPIVGYFYARLKTLTEALENDSQDSVKEAVLSGQVGDEDFAGELAAYIVAIKTALNGKTPTEIVAPGFAFPDFRAQT